MKNLKLSTFVYFRTDEDRNEFNRLVKKEILTFLPICKDKTTAIHCAVWKILRNNPALWDMGPCLEHHNYAESTWTSHERIAAGMEALA